TAIHEMPMAKGRAGMASKSWGWLRGHWLDIMLPPAIFLVCAGITRQVLWVRAEQSNARSGQHYKASQQAEQKGDHARALRELEATAREAPDNADAHFKLAEAFQSLHQPASGLLHQEKALEMRPGTEAQCVQLIAGYVMLEKFQDAERVMKRDAMPR